MSIVAGSKIAWWISSDAVNDLESLKIPVNNNTLLGGALVELAHVHEQVFEEDSEKISCTYVLDGIKITVERRDAAE